MFGYKEGVSCFFVKEKLVWEREGVRFQVGDVKEVEFFFIVRLLYLLLVGIFQWLSKRELGCYKVYVFRNCQFQFSSIRDGNKVFLLVF